MKSLLKWFAATVAKLNCFVNGHGPFDVLHIYDTAEHIRHFEDVGPGKIRVVPSYKIIYARQKRRCFKCGRVSVDIVRIGSQAVRQ